MTDGGTSEDYTVKCPECPWESLPEKTHAEAVGSARRHWDYNHGPTRHRSHISTYPRPEKPQEGR